MNYTQVNPYTLGKNSRLASIFWRTISFEGTPVVTVRSSDAQEVVDLLNTAYNVGFNTGRVYGEAK